MRVSEVRITPVAVPDVSLLNTKGVHGAHFLRSIIEIGTDDGPVSVSRRPTGRCVACLACNRRRMR